MNDLICKQSTPRRVWFSQVAALSVMSMIQDSVANGDTPVMRGIQSIQGTVTVNGMLAKVGTIVKVGDRISTSVKTGSSAVVVIGNDAYLLREDTTIIFQFLRGAPKNQIPHAMAFGETFSFEV